MNSIVIFGGSGFIGSHMVRELSLLGIEKIIIADLKEPHHLINSNVEYRKCDVRHPISTDILANPSVVVNLAAVHRTPGHPDHEYFETNVNGAENIVDYCNRTDCSTLWFTSSISVYGPSEEPKTEHSIPQPESAYGKSKLKAENIHCQWVENGRNRKLVIVRPAVVFGARENGNFTKLARAMQRGAFVYPGRRDTIKGCGYVEDLIGSLFFMNEQPEKSVLYNYCYSKQYTIQNICEAFAKVAGYRKPLGTLPLAPMLNAARVFQFLNSVGLKNGIHPARIYKLVRSTNIIPGELIKRNYHYRTDLEEGLRRWLADEPEGVFI
ncbi:MAG: NAD(P)-dependent oxidoreductase [Desulfuromonadales bacterium]